MQEHKIITGNMLVDKTVDNMTVDKMTPDKMTVAKMNVRKIASTKNDYR